MTTDWRATKVTPGRELTLKGFQVLSGRSIGIFHPPSSTSSSSLGPLQAPCCSWISGDVIESQSASSNRNRVGFGKDSTVVLTRIPQDTINIHIGCDLNPDGVRDGRRNSESFGYRLIRNNTTASVTVRRKPRKKVLQPGKRLPATPRPSVSTAVEIPESPGGRVTGALICTKSTLSNPSTKLPVSVRKRADHFPGPSAGKEDEEPDQNLTDQPRCQRWRSPTCATVPPSVTFLSFRDRGRQPPADPCVFSDPFVCSSSSFQKRIAELISLEAQTIQSEKRRQTKTSKLQTKSG